VTVFDTHAILEDLGSKNGTTFDGAPLNRTATLRNGDEFACGQVVITYRQSGVELATATQASHAHGSRARR
jgi:pSer/pThr/pTyr-binding forkhead associated (FHA) protein